jgi:hypothetical protein
MVKRQKAGRFSFKEDRLLLEMASERTPESAAARLRRPVPTVRKKALKLGVSLKEHGRKRTS